MCYQIAADVQNYFACSDEGPSNPCPFEDLEEADEENMSESDWHMQQAIEASMSGQAVNPSIEEEMFGKPHTQIQSRVSGLTKSWCCNSWFMTLRLGPCCDYQNNFYPMQTLRSRESEVKFSSTEMNTKDL